MFVITFLADSFALKKRIMCGLEEEITLRARLLLFLFAHCRTLTFWFLSLLVSLIDIALTLTDRSLAEKWGFYTWMSTTYRRNGRTFG